MPSDKSVHKAKMAAAFRQAKELHKHFRVLEVSPNHVVFFFGGYHIRYEFYQGETVRRGSDQTYLQAEDYAYLATLATLEMKANIRGLNSNKEATAAKRTQPKNVQLQLPFLFTGQAPSTGSLT